MTELKDARVLAGLVIARIMDKGEERSTYDNVMLLLAHDILFAQGIDKPEAVNYANEVVRQMREIETDLGLVG